MKNKFLLFFVFFGAGFYLFAQDSFTQEDLSSRQGSIIEQPLDEPALDPVRNIMLARSSPDYRVTPGDVYTLIYSAGTVPVTYIITVDNSYRIRVSNLGIVNGAGKTFVQLKSEIETVVINNYPLSGAQLTLTQPAIFRVFVNGEVNTAREFSVWALNRLSALVNNNLTEYASIRDVSVISANGQTRNYDLFRAQRLGDLSQDPFLRPGDTVTFNRVARSVGIEGAVERPGMYQLLDGENIKELIEIYGSGFSPAADGTRVELLRFVNSVDVAGDKLFLSEDDLANNYTLENYDSITVPFITQLQPVFFVEGAVIPSTRADIQSHELNAANRLIIPFNSGDTYASVVRRNTSWFTAVSDTQNAYIIREDRHIPINLNPMLYDATYRGEVLVEENDTLIIPFRQYFVTVSGAVMNPGRFPYIPDRSWEYYVALAGGFVPGRNSMAAIKIVDLNGNQLKKTDAITPETIITASTNHGLYFFNQYAPIVTTILGLITTGISIYLISGR